MLFKRNVHVLKMVDSDGGAIGPESVDEEPLPSTPESTLRESNISLQLPVINLDIEKVLTGHYEEFKESTHKKREFAQFGAMFSFIAKMMFNETAHFNFPTGTENREREFLDKLVKTVRLCLQKVNESSDIDLPDDLNIEDVPPFIFIFSLFIDAETYLKTEIGLHDKRTSVEWKNGFAKYLINETFKECVIQNGDRLIIEKFFNKYRIEEMPVSVLKDFIVCLQLLKCLRKDEESTIFDNAETGVPFKCKDMILHLFDKVKEEYSSNNFSVLQHEIMDHCARFLNMFPMLVSSGLKVGNMTTSKESEFYGIVDTDQILTCDIVVNVNMRAEAAESPERLRPCLYVVFYPDNISDGNTDYETMIQNIGPHIFRNFSDVTTMHNHLYFLRPNVQLYDAQISKAYSEARSVVESIDLSNATQYGFYPSYLKGWYNNDDMREMLVTIVHQNDPSKVYGISINDKIISRLTVRSVEDRGEVAGSTSSEEPTGDLAE